MKLVKGETMMSYSIDGPEQLTYDELYKWVNETATIDRRPPASGFLVT